MVYLEGNEISWFLLGACMMTTEAGNNLSGMIILPLHTNTLYLGQSSLKNSPVHHLNRLSSLGNLAGELYRRSTEKVAMVAVTKTWMDPGVPAAEYVLILETYDSSGTCSVDSTMPWTRTLLATFPRRSAESKFRRASPKKT